MNVNDLEFLDFSRLLRSAGIRYRSGMTRDEIIVEMRRKGAIDADGTLTAQHEATIDEYRNRRLEHALGRMVG